MKLQNHRILFTFAVAFLLFNESNDVKMTGFLTIMRQKRKTFWEALAMTNIKIASYVRWRSPTFRKNKYLRVFQA